ncbi:MAG: hypothetical protein ABIS18_05115, partial [Actinomycetota bacterium]
FGPFHVPAGQDLNRITLDLPVNNGFYTAIAPDLIDVATGEEPSHQVAHIHHAHWFRSTNDPNDERYNTGLEFGDQGFSWVFGTGEEETQGSLDARADVDPTGPRYGLYIDGDSPQMLIYMLHNKTARPLNLFVLLRVKFVSGTADEIKTATGKEFHPLRGKLWGTTFDVPREANGDGTYVHPLDIPVGGPGYNAAFSTRGKFFTSGFSGTIVAGAGHLHPAGREVVISNLGPAGSGCEADSDSDGYPGITLVHSRKFEHVAANNYSEDYQMGATKNGFRAPIRVGDRIAQFGVYSNDLYASYQAMSYAGLYTDTLQVPAAATGCNATSYAPILLAGDPVGGDVTEGVLNHPRTHAPDPHCELAVSPFNGPCNVAERPWLNSVETNSVHIGGFKYLPGDEGSSGVARVLPQVKQGKSITFINEDAALGIRHTVTSCGWPCNGPYVANYPMPDATFDSAMLGNVDPVDGSAFKVNWSTPTGLGVGRYSYFCRTHPWMRGAFEVI